MTLNQKWTFAASKFRCRDDVVFDQSKGIQTTLKKEKIVKILNPK